MRVNFTNPTMFSANRRNPFAKAFAVKTNRKKTTAGGAAESDPSDMKKKQIEEIKKELSQLSKKKNPTKADRIRQKQLQQKLIDLQKQSVKENKQAAKLTAATGGDQSFEAASAEPHDTSTASASPTTTGTHIDMTV